MRNAGLTVFVLFFGVSLVDAFANHAWERAVLWLAAGIAFWALDRFGFRHGGRS